MSQKPIKVSKGMHRQLLKTFISTSPAKSKLSQPKRSLLFLLGRNRKGVYTKAVRVVTGPGGCCYPAIAGSQMAGAYQKLVEANRTPSGWGVISNHRPIPGQPGNDWRQCSIMGMVGDFPDMDFVMYSFTTPDGCRYNAGSSDECPVIITS